MHAGQLDAQGKANVELKQQSGELRKEIASYREELQITSAKLVGRCYYCLTSMTAAGSVQLYACSQSQLRRIWHCLRLAC